MSEVTVEADGIKVEIFSVSHLVLKEGIVSRGEEDAHLARHAHAVADDPEDGHGHGGHDGQDRALRYLEWTWDPDPSDSTYTVDFAYLLRERSGSVRVEQDRHVLGLFTRAEWLRYLGEVGFEPSVVRSRHSDPDTLVHEVFLAIKPASGPTLPTADA